MTPVLITSIVGFVVLVVVIFLALRLNRRDSASAGTMSTGKMSMARKMFIIICVVVLVVIIAVVIVHNVSG